MGCITPLTARINKILKMLEPIIFPTAISAFFLRAATIDVANSGSDVPAATTVSPMIFWLMPIDSAISIALFTTRWPPSTSPARPPTIKTHVLAPDSAGILTNSSVSAGSLLSFALSESGESETVPL